MTDSSEKPAENGPEPLPATPPPSEPNEPYPQPAPEQPPSSPPPAEPPRRGCWSRFVGTVGWLFTVVFTVVLALAAAGALAYYVLGYSWTTPTDLANARNELVLVQERNATLEAHLAELQERTNDLAGRVNNSSEALDELRPQLQELQIQATEIARLGGDLRENVAIAATIQADARDSQAAVEAIATVQANSNERLSELSQRTDRLVRFLDRLGDIAEDTASDLNPTDTMTPTVTPTATASALTVTPSPTTTDEPAEDEDAEVTPTPTATADN